MARGLALGLALAASACVPPETGDRVVVLEVGNAAATQLDEILIESESDGTLSFQYDWRPLEDRALSYVVLTVPMSNVSAGESFQVSGYERGRRRTAFSRFSSPETSEAVSRDYVYLQPRAVLGRGARCSEDEECLSDLCVDRRCI